MRERNLHLASIGELQQLRAEWVRLFNKATAAGATRTADGFKASILKIDHVMAIKAGSIAA